MRRQRHPPKPRLFGVVAFFVTCASFVGLACETDEAEINTDCPLEDNRLTEEADEWDDAIAAHQLCVDEEDDCDGPHYISSQMAQCLVEEHGLGEGIAPWESHVTHHGEFGRVVWNVRNTEHTEPGGRGESSRGTMMTVDAQSGRFLGESAWMRMP